MQNGKVVGMVVAKQRQKIDMQKSDKQSKNK